MRTTERLRKLKAWIYENLCQGREMKAPAKDGNITELVRQEPKVYIAYFPMRPDLSAYAPPEEALNTAPSILIMPAGGSAKFKEKTTEESVKGVRRNPEMSQSLEVQLLFTVYQDGLRLPGFIDKAEAGEIDTSLIMEGSEDGLFTLTNWMDDFNRLILSEKCVPGTDMFAEEETVTYGMHRDQNYITDRRPLFYGICTVTFRCHADEYSREINDLLR